MTELFAAEKQVANIVLRKVHYYLNMPSVQ